MLSKSLITTHSGFSYPFGTSMTKSGGINFALVSFQAKEVTLHLFDRQTKVEIADFPMNKTGAVWHIELLGIEDPKQLAYAYKTAPPVTDTQQWVLDPYAKAVSTPITWGSASPYTPYGEIVVDNSFDWEDDKLPNIPKKDLIIYEMHVRSFTIDPSSGTASPGTFLGVIEKIPHLLALGINAVELMPINEFNESEYTTYHPELKDRLYNVWGYSTVNFFAPMNRYSASDASGAAIHEFKQMVKALHKNGIEVILDVVFNHTAEGGKTGPVLSFKGLDNAIYYMMDHGNYQNFSGCGNTFNSNQPIVLEMIITCLRYWVTEMHVDGFRFDLASIFSRDRLGRPLPITSIVKAITQDPILASVKLIAEPWDAAGFYQVGSFAACSPRWSEWNDRYRDTIRSFIKGTGVSGEFARRLSGSEDLYHERGPQGSLNFITAHDGFTLADLVSYNEKHNEANGENNNDGHNNNESWNCGAEGNTDDPAVITLRTRQMRNYYLALMLSQGMPMVLMGDEYGHTKEGNNNTWCQDNHLNWFSWKKLEEKPCDDFPRFCRLITHFRKQHALLRRDSFLTEKDIDWHGITPMNADWAGHAFLALTLKDHESGNDLYAAFNTQDKPAEVTLPEPGEGKRWHWVVNTGNPSPTDIYEQDHLPLVESNNMTLLPFSAILLKCKQI